ncbi:MAG: glycosyltransferase [Leptospiraceae bacterium]|nr:glycosyltransferase [Leptospiraceae bacterium]
MPKLSIITINLNNADGLEKTILSVKSQTWKDLEHIVIDGGSRDNSKGIIEKYRNGISYTVSEKDNGIYDAQNKGIQNAKGEYCLFLNSGDFLVNDSVLEIVFSKKINTDIIYGDMLIDYGNGKVEYGKSPERLTLFFLAYRVLWHCVTLIRRNLFLRHGMYDTTFKIVADVDFFLNAIGVGRATSSYIPIAISQFNTQGFGSDPKNLPILEEERRRSRAKHLPVFTRIFLGSIDFVYSKVRFLLKRLK